MLAAAWLTAAVMPALLPCLPIMLLLFEDKPVTAGDMAPPRRNSAAASSLSEQPPGKTKKEQKNALYLSSYVGSSPCLQPHLPSSLSLSPLTLTSLSLSSHISYTGVGRLPACLPARDMVEQRPRICQNPLLVARSTIVCYITIALAKCAPRCCVPPPPDAIVGERVRLFGFRGGDTLAWQAWARVLRHPPRCRLNFQAAATWWRILHKRQPAHLSSSCRPACRISRVAFLPQQLCRWQRTFSCAYCLPYRPGFQAWLLVRRGRTAGRHSCHHPSGVCSFPYAAAIAFHSNKLRTFRSYLSPLPTGSYAVYCMFLLFYACILSCRRALFTALARHLSCGAYVMAAPETDAHLAALRCAAWRRRAFVLGRFRTAYAHARFALRAWRVFLRACAGYRTRDCRTPRRALLCCLYLPRRHAHEGFTTARAAALARCIYAP